MPDYYYTVINGTKYDRAVLEFCLEAEQRSDVGEISRRDAEKLLELFRDNERFKIVECDSFEYVAVNYRWEDGALEWLRAELEAWVKTLAANRK